MKSKLVIALLMFLAANAMAQQKVIPLYGGAAPGSENWTYNEKEYRDTNWHSEVAYNVSHPTLTVYLADPPISTGTAVIVCPGGGFHILAMKIEGTDVAAWLNKKGVTVFILKYRLGQSLTNSPVTELQENMQKPGFGDKIKLIIPLDIADGHEAVKYVRAHAAEYGISTSRIGIIGFSAGGTVAAATAFNYTADDRPDFVAPIYAYIPPDLPGEIAPDEPPAFFCAATDDGLGLASHSVNLYSKWLEAKKPAELHIYQKGGHGFGMTKQNIPTDTWIERFGDWLGMLGYLTPVDPKITKYLEDVAKNDKFFAELPRKDWPFLERYEGENGAVPAPAAGEKRVVFMGNSITEGWKNLDAAFFTGRPYYDRGISGQTTGQMLVRFREDVINLKPKVVVILGGINDIAQNNGPEKLEDIFGNLRSMTELARVSHVKVVVSSVLPAVVIPWRPSIKPGDKVARLNEMLKNYCKENGIVYLDYFSVMADSNGGLPVNLSKDGVHPTLEGYKIMEPLVEKAIDEAIQTEK